MLVPCSRSKRVYFYRTYIVENNERLGPTALVIADSVEDTTANKCGNELLNEEDEQDEADGGEVEVVDQEQSLELERLAAAHQLSATKDDSVVDNDEDRGRLEGGHGRLKRHEFELIDGVAHNGRPCLVEDGP